MDVRKGKVYNPFQNLTQIIKMAFMGAIVLTFIFMINQFKLSHYFPIQTVRVYGAKHLEPEEMMDMLGPLVDKGFFNVNVTSIRDRLLQTPWVANILVRRHWPNQVEIMVVEKNAIANWRSSLLSEKGELFTPHQSTYPEDLPTFVGPEGKQVIMLEYYNKINRLLGPLHAKISHFELTPYLTWNLTLDNGINLQIGHKDILTRLDHFVKVYPKIVGNRIKDVEYIDLRYPNGVAVRWKNSNRLEAATLYGENTQENGKILAIR